jgi:hypothetical protein
VASSGTPSLEGMSTSVSWNGPYPDENPGSPIARRKIRAIWRSGAQIHRVEGAHRIRGRAGRGCPEIPQSGQTIGRAVEAATSLPPGACAAPVGLACSIRLARGAEVRRGTRSGPGSAVPAGYALLPGRGARRRRHPARRLPDVRRSRLSLANGGSANGCLSRSPSLGIVDIESMELAEIEQFVAGGVVNTEGRVFRVSVSGNPGPAVGVVLDGSAWLSCRRPICRGPVPSKVRSRGTTARREPDKPEVLSGVYKDRTTGTPICIVFRNRDTVPFDYEPSRGTPSRTCGFHGSGRYRGFQDSRGSGHFSGRLTAGLVAAGVVAKKKYFGAPCSKTGCGGGGADGRVGRGARGRGEGDSIGAIGRCAFGICPQDSESLFSMRWKAG